MISKTLRTKKKLTDEARTFAVQRLAMFDPPSIVALAIRKDFGTAITPQAIESYDPTKRAGARLSSKWCELFDATRKMFFENIAAIGVTHQVVRHRALQRMADKAESVGNIELAAKLLEQVAKEMGGFYTNRREITGKDGAALPVQSQVAIFQLPDNGRG